ncbi:hypothetical protein [Vibrio tetraodonis]|nr:hypothetical protein [Vibrio tetraodonis]
MYAWLKKWIVRYDSWCESMGLVEANRRRCVLYRDDSNDQVSISTHKAQ